MNAHPCLECGEPLTVRAHKERTRVGRYTVEDDSARVPVCPNGHTELALEELAGFERRAAMVVLSEAADIGGAEIRFARKAMGLTGVRLGRLLDVKPETISRWENGHETMSRVSRLALLAVVKDLPALERIEHDPAKVSEVLHVHDAEHAA
jgi:DNA-binding transcriptional regulator YiaG